MTSPLCNVADAPGQWVGNEWMVQNMSRCPLPLHRFVSIAPHCLARGKGGAGPACVQKHSAALARLGGSNASVLLLGDSTASYLHTHSCGAFGARPVPFIAAGNLTARQRHAYAHRLRSHDQHACRLPTGPGGDGVMLGIFAHYGVTGPPYWSYAYPLAPWLGSTTGQMLASDTVCFSAAALRGRDPTLIVLGSGFWDISAWWANGIGHAEGNFSRTFEVGPPHVDAYVTGVRRAVDSLRFLYPSSRLLWRTLHPGAKHKITPANCRLLNAAVRARALEWRLEVWDVGGMMEALPQLAFLPAKSPAYGTSDGRHLHEWLNIELLNLLLNALLETLGGVETLTKPLGASMRGVKELAGPGRGSGPPAGDPGPAGLTDASGGGAPGGSGAATGERPRRAGERPRRAREPLPGALASVGTTAVSRPAPADGLRGCKSPAELPPEVLGAAWPGHRAE